MVSVGAFVNSTVIDHRDVRNICRVSVYYGIVRSAYSYKLCVFVREMLVGDIDAVLRGGVVVVSFVTAVPSVVLFVGLVVIEIERVSWLVISVSAER